MRIPLGKFNRKLQIMKLSQVSDGGGGYEDKLLEIKTVWGNISPIKGKEYWQAQQSQASVTHEITIRYTKDIDASHILKYQDRLFDIQYMTSLREEDNYLEIRVLERQ